MVRLCIALTISLVFISCNSNSQNKIDVPKSLKLFKEGGDVMKKGFTTEFSDSLAAQTYYRQAIILFNASLQADPANVRLGTYLSDLYYKEQKFDSALIWAMRLFPIDSALYYKDNLRAISSSYGFIGSCFIYEGDLETGEKYFCMAFKTDTAQVIALTQQLSDISDKLYFKSIPAQLQKLKAKNIDPCKYAIEIMQLGLSIGKNEKFTTDYLFPKDKIRDRGTTCR
jgi:tetratricopeptide (TPR) repeat protein